MGAAGMSSPAIMNELVPPLSVEDVLRIFSVGVLLGSCLTAVAFLVADALFYWARKGKRGD